MQKVPDDLARRPPSPGCSSTLHTIVPSGMRCKGNTFPTSAEASSPTVIPWFKARPSGAVRQHAVPFPNSIRASGVPLADSCMISFTTPRRDGCFSSLIGNLTGAIRLNVRALKTEPPFPRRCTRICLPNDSQIQRSISTISCYFARRLGRLKINLVLCLTADPKVS